jgi:hypothetical protein
LIHLRGEKPMQLLTYDSSRVYKEDAIDANKNNSAALRKLRKSIGFPRVVKRVISNPSAFINRELKDSAAHTTPSQYVTRAISFTTIVPSATWA